jgi:hypothetical protein
MHLTQHLFASWLLPWTALAERRDRILVAAAGIAPDVDAPVLLLWGGKRAFVEHHHEFTHHVAGAALAAAAGFALGRSRGRTAAFAAGAWLLHLFLDMAGAGERFEDGSFAYPLPLLRPFSARGTDPFPWSWPLASWQNALFLACLLVLVGRMGVVHGRTVVEVLSPRADAGVVAALRRRWGGGGARS